MDDALRKLLNIGTMLSNCAFNLAQEGVSLDSRARETLKQLQTDWDKALIEVRREEAERERLLKALEWMSAEEPHIRVERKRVTLYKNPQAAQRGEYLATERNDGTGPDILRALLEAVEAAQSCRRCGGAGAYLVAYHGPQEVKCESCDGTGEQKGEK